MSLRTVKKSFASFYQKALKARGEINQSEFKYVNNIFDFDNRVAKEIMVPRTEVVSIDQEDTVEYILEMVQSGLPAIRLLIKIKTILLEWSISKRF